MAYRNVGLSTLALAVTLAGCSGTDGGFFHRPDSAFSGQTAELTRASDCDTLLTQFQQDAIEKVEMQTAELMRWQLGGTAGRFFGPPEASADAGTAADDVTPDEFSETNTQVEGVDEADFVKTNGTHIYLLQGNELLVLKSWPANETAVLSRFELEGQPREFYVDGDRAVVFSSLADPREEPNSACPRGGFGPCYYGTPFTKVSVLRLVNDVASLERELYLEGNYNSSRRYSSIVRTILQTWGHFYHFDVPSPWEVIYGEDGSGEPTRRSIYRWRAQAIAAIRRTSLEDWVPARLERRAGQLVELPTQCDGFHSPAPGHASDGLVQIVGFDFSDPTSTVSQTAISGYAQNIYSNLETLLITQPDYGSWWRAYQLRLPNYRDWTLLHKFRLNDQGDARYAASGVLPGHTLNQFSLHARGEDVFAATTQMEHFAWWLNDEGWTPPISRNQLVAMREQRGRLAMVGSTPALAEGEMIQSARFVGDIAYMVTFRQVDPLFAIDIEDASKLKVLGELKIEGFSTYMHPMDDTHLLTIGFDADPETGQTRGLQLQIFDVSNPVSPQRTHQHVFRDRWGYSQATWDHKAFTFFPSRALLAFPYQAWSTDDYRSSLELFRIDTETGIDPLASIDHSSSVDSVCPVEEGWGSSCWSQLAQVRRGLFVEDYVYSISYGAMQVHDTRDMSSVTEVPLPQDGVHNFYYWWW